MDRVKVQADVLRTIEESYPEVVKMFVGANARSERAFRKKVKVMKRWNQVGKAVGWVAVALGDYFPSKLLSEANEASFGAYLENYAKMRDQLLKLISEYWPDAPDFVKSIEGLLIFNTRC